LIYLNKSVNLISGVEGTGSAIHTGNFTTHIINTTATNVIRATLTTVTFEPAGTDVILYLSNDDGTTFEEVTSGGSHLFQSTGNKIRAKFELSSTSDITTPLVMDYTVEVVSSSMDGLEIDIGDDNSPEMVLDFILNSTTTPLLYNSTDDPLNFFIFNFCKILSNPNFIYFWFWWDFTNIGVACV